MTSSVRSSSTSSATGKLLQAPVPFPDGMSPQNPYLQPGQATRIGASRGFEAMGGSADGSSSTRSSRAPSPTTPTSGAAGSTSSTPRAGQYTGKRWAYQTDEATNFAGDAFTVKKGKLLVDERDNYDGPAAVTKRIYEVDLNHTDAQGFVAKSLVVDLLKIANPDGIGLTTSPGAYGVERPVLVPVRLGGDGGPAPRRQPAHRQRQQLPGRRRPEPGHPRRHRDGDHRPGRQGADAPALGHA